MVSLGSWLVLGLISLPQQQRQPALAHAQYVQAVTSGWVPAPTGGSVIQVPQWRPTVNDPLQRVIDISPDLVVLEYNCWYMKDICKNADNWYKTPRGQARSVPNRFAYDFASGKASSWRNQQRRRASCGSWDSNRMCPHSDQGIVMRHDGPWQYKDLEPGTTIAEIRAKRDSQGNKIPSWVRYTCDEFPPATWIEGGSGSPSPEAQPADAQTRCAAFRCNGRFSLFGLRIKVKAEQNWQATAHDVLQRSLKGVINRRISDFPWFVNKGSVAFFEFRYNLLNTNANGVAATVTTFSPGSAPVIKPITQAKRDILAERNGTVREEDLSPEQLAALNHEAFWRWADTVTVEELMAFGPGVVSQQHVLANHTEAAGMMMTPQAPGMMTSLPWMDFATSSDEEDWDPEEYHTLPDVVSDKPRADPNKLKRAASEGATSTPLLRNATSTALARAQQLVEEAIANSTRLNAARYANPARNRYQLKPRTSFGRRDTADAAAPPPPLLDITDELADAAALVSEAEAKGGLIDNASVRNTIQRTQAASSGTFWMEHVARIGTVAFGNSSNYKVFRNVLDYGAKGDNTTDDTKAIKLAMTDGTRCGVKCNGSTLKNAIVYFPPGNYRISSTIPMPFGTQVIGDANDPPTLIATKSFIGLGVLSSDEYTGGGKGADGLDQEYYINTANFYRQLRNIRIDITQTRAAQGVAGVHWQVAQATSMQNVEIIAVAGTTMRGIFAENGSGGTISDVTFRGGKYGLYGGNQQFTAQRLTFIGCDTGVQVIWDWGWIWKSITMTNVGVGFRLLQENTNKATSKRQASGGGQGNIGSASFIDSTFTNVGTAVLVAPPQDKAGSGSTGVIIDNVAVSGVSKVVADTGGSTLLAAPASGTVHHWALGPVYQEAGPDYALGKKVDNDFRRVPGLLDSKGAYFERAKPQYQDRPVGDFVHVKDFGAKGDGTTDDTAALQRALYGSLGQILIIDAGSYILTGTVVVPVGSKIVGETWSQLMASGSFFQDAANPKVMLQVGQNGDVGDVEMQDLLFTSRGATPGLILVQWNVRGASAGSAGMWDCHARLGGATGTLLTPAECPALTSGIAQGCNAASLMMHITPLASAYFENVWLWGSDHMIDDPDLNDANNTMVQNSVYVARGFLIESVSPTWLYGTASEHAVFYQYNFNKAQNIFAGMIQTESPYYQPTPKPPAPFANAVGVFASDPSYANCTAGNADNELGGCDEAWAVIMRGCANVMVAGAGLYSWFSTYSEDCIDQHACQKVLMLLEDNHSGVRFQQLITIGAKYMAVMNGKAISAVDYLNVETHPKWSQVSVMDVKSDGLLAEMFYVDPKIWDMDQPAFTCVPPCRVVIPPWTGATRTVNYPLVTITDGTFSTTITRPPLTMTKMLFEPVTYTVPSDGGNQKKKRAGESTSVFWPKPAKLAHWPAVTYTNKDGNILAATPTVPFPDPPTTIGPSAPAPTAGGSWPKREITLHVGDLDDPTLEDDFWKECAYINGSYDCPSWLDPYVYGDTKGGPPATGNSGDVPDNDDNTDEDYGDLDTVCPQECDGSHKQYVNPFPLCPRDDTSSTTTSSTSTTSATPTPTLAVGDPMTNTRDCYNSGQKATNDQMANTARSFCREMGNEGTELRAEKGSGGVMAYTRNYELDGGGWPIHIVGEFFIKEGCRFVVNQAQCLRYFKVIIDSCNCDGADGKQGGIMDNNCYRLRLDPNTFS